MDPIGTMPRAPEETEVVAKPARRRVTAEYKRKILHEVDACRQPGEVAALLRREGLYSSHLAAWRAARRRGELAGLTPKARGPKPTRPDPRDRKLAEQEREIRRWQARAERAEALVELQKKVADLLGVTLPEPRGTR